MPPYSNTNFRFDFVEFSSRKWFNFQKVSNKVDAPYSLRDFQRYEERGMKCCGLGDFSMTKQNKTNYIVS
jgi:hypothetical protein